MDFLTALITLSCLCILADAQSGANYKLCQDKRIELTGVGHNATMVYSRQDSGSNPCVLHIKSCANCRIKLKPDPNVNFSFKCPGQADSGNRFTCTLSCDYLYIFDKYYKDKLKNFYHSIDGNSLFKSESNEVFIGVCHGYSNYSFNFDIESEDKYEKKAGSSGSIQADGQFLSPFFPYPYAINHEIYTYEIQSVNSNEFVTLVFNDWNIHPSSSFAFTNSNIVGQVHAHMKRPMVQSDGNVLVFKFQTGILNNTEQNTDYIGWTAKYSINRAKVSLPNPDCGTDGYWSDIGGKIVFERQSHSSTLYDCLWVIKLQPGYDHVRLVINKFRALDAGLVSGDNMLEIHEGTTSKGNKVLRYDIKDNKEDAVAVELRDGAYIRYRGLFASNYQLRMSFNLFSKVTPCSSDQFSCSNGICIARELACDNSDDCGDKSDEGESGCAVNMDPHKSYQYTITIGVIVPMVISVFLIMIICLLFVMIRRCRRAQREATAANSDRIQTLSEDVSESSDRRGRRRRRRRHRNLNGERDMPPTYEEAIQNPPCWNSNLAFGNPVDPNLPSPPPYTEMEAGRRENTGQNSSQRHPGSPTSTNSSQSEVTIGSRNRSDDSTSSSSSEEGSTWGIYPPDGEGRRGRIGRHISSSGSERSRVRSQVQSRGHSGQRHGNRSERPESRTSSVTQGTELSNLEEEREVGRKSNERNLKLDLKPNVIVSQEHIPLSEGPKPQVQTFRQVGRPVDKLEGSISPVSFEIHQEHLSEQNQRVPGNHPKPVPSKRKSKTLTNDLKKRSASVEHLQQSDSDIEFGFGRSKPGMARARSVEVLDKRTARQPNSIEESPTRYNYDNLAASTSDDGSRDVMVVYDNARNDELPSTHPHFQALSASNLALTLHDPVSSRDNVSTSISMQAGPGNMTSRAKRTGQNLEKEEQNSNMSSRELESQVQGLSNESGSRMSFIWDKEDQNDVYV
ncbi:uncharacterized protein LOC128243240 [Mya arenaria]|uniref:uncharacterized protein LOC128243240 n=1 Tax=Mya arenaria TaxID=6604 RepID=UPI0022E467EC|nr:uncharacterized protein LOC128243240 [Mya arenaria]XP_052816823.1 uncharacterized protein LOC128243240 [Mya arenaria]